MFECVARARKSEPRQRNEEMDSVEVVEDIYQARQRQWREKERRTESSPRLVSSREEFVFPEIRKLTYTDISVDPRGNGSGAAGWSVRDEGRR